MVQSWVERMRVSSAVILLNLYLAYRVWVFMESNLRRRREAKRSGPEGEAPFDCWLETEILNLISASCVVW